MIGGFGENSSYSGCFPIGIGGFPSGSEVPIANVFRYGSARYWTLLGPIHMGIQTSNNKVIK